MAKPSIVYFANQRATIKRSFIDKIDFLISELKKLSKLKQGGFTAIKLHFGERGNTAFISPILVQRFVKAIKKLGSRPFLTDCNTLYAGTRSDAPSHLVTAIENGFAYSVVNAPLIISDGLKGHSSIAINVGLPECNEVLIGKEIVEADNLICLTHFKGHELTGFGGTIKNLGMGCASRQGKLFQHSNISPKIKENICIGCSDCVMRCPNNAIKLVNRTESIQLDSNEVKSSSPYVAYKEQNKCIGCGDCILTCPNKAIQIQWDTQITEFMHRMVAYTKGVLTNKKDKALFFNFLLQITPACDCYPFSDAPIVNDLGALASLDPVAIDQASVDLVIQSKGLSTSCLKQAYAPGQDKFRDLYPKVNWEIQLNYAQKLGLGNREYELVKI